MATADVGADFFDASTHYTGPPVTDAMVVAAERMLVPWSVGITARRRPKL